MITFLVPESRSVTFRYFLEDRGGPHADRFTILYSEQLPQARALAPGTYVFAFDDQLLAERRALAAVWDQLAAAAPAARLLNHPIATMGRFALLRTLHETGRSRVRAIRATDPIDSLRFPVFVHEETRHTGNLTPLLHSPREVRRALNRLALRGLRRRDLLVIEYCDTSDGQGVFRKYSAYAVGDRVIPRCLEYGHGWMVKHNARTYTPTRIAEEREYVESNPHETLLREVFSLAHVDFGRVDYAMVDGTPQIWEINLIPTIGRFRPRELESADTQRVRHLRREANNIFYARFLAAWEALDTCAGGAAIPIRADAGLWRAARHARARWRWGQRHRRVVAWAADQPVVSAAWRLLKRARDFSTSLQRPRSGRQ